MASYTTYSLSTSVDNVFGHESNPKAHQFYEPEPVKTSELVRIVGSA